MCIQCNHAPDLFNYIREPREAARSPRNRPSYLLKILYIQHLRPVWIETQCGPKPRRAYTLDDAGFTIRRYAYNLRAIVPRLVGPDV